MANISKVNLQDKDIRKLEILPKQYKKAVGNPKELYIWVNPSGIKTFSVRYNEKFIKIREFREGIYSVAEARKDATKLLKELESGKDIITAQGKNEKYLFRNLFELYIEQKRRNGVMESTLKRDIQLFNKNLFPSLANKDVKEIKYSDLLAIFNAMFNPHNPLQSRLETIHRTIRQLHKIFEIALKDRYIDFDPSFGLSSEFPTKKRFNQNNQIDTRFASITDNEILKSFICDLKCANYHDGQTKRALYLQILCVNRPINTASAKWADIDLENGIWNIPAIEMKTRLPHQIALSKQAIKVLKE